MYICLSVSQTKPPLTQTNTHRKHTSNVTQCRVQNDMPHHRYSILSCSCLRLIIALFICTPSPTAFLSASPVRRICAQAQLRCFTTQFICETSQSYIYIYIYICISYYSDIDVTINISPPSCPTNTGCRTVLTIEGNPLLYNDIRYYRRKSLTIEGNPLL